MERRSESDHPRAPTHTTERVTKLLVFGDKELGDLLFRSRSATAAAFASACEIPAVLRLLATALKLPAEALIGERIWLFCARVTGRLPAPSLAGAGA